MTSDAERLCCGPPLRVHSCAGPLSFSPVGVLPSLSLCLSVCPSLLARRPSLILSLSSELEPCGVSACSCPWLPFPSLLGLPMAAVPARGCCPLPTAPARGCRLLPLPVAAVPSPRARPWLPSPPAVPARGCRPLSVCPQVPGALRGSAALLVPLSLLCLGVFGILDDPTLISSFLPFLSSFQEQALTD